jgi:hypothetical protein
MKNRINLLLVMFLAISLALPIYSTAQTQTTPTLTLESYTTGDRISGGPIKSFSMGPDNNLVVYLDGPFNFTDLYPDISLNDTAGSYTPSSLVVTKPASVTATQPAAGTAYTITFKVTSATAGTTFTMPVSPESMASFDSTTKTFSWNIGGSTPVALGSYLAVFQGTSGDYKSQLVVMINITPPGYTLTVNTVGDGTVTKNPAQDTYTTNPVQNVQLTPNVGSGYSFSGWSGDLSGSANPANIVMNRNKTVTATFTQTPPNQYTLTVTVSPSSSAGTVSLNPSGGSYTAGTQVTLTAMPNANYAFSSWSGVDLISGTTTASVTMGSANRSVTANFTASSPPPPSGSLGTKTNPYKINKSTSRIYNGYISQISPDGSRGDIIIPAGSKFYFEVDPVATIGTSVGAFKISVGFFSGAGSVCKLTQDKSTGAYSSEVCQGTDSYMDIVWDGRPYTIANTKFLYALDNSGSPGAVSDQLWAIFPFVP